MYSTLSEIKQHLNIDEAFKDDDQLLLLYIQTAEEAVQRDLDRPLHRLVDPVSGYLPFPIKAATLMLVANLYANRENVNVVKLTENPTYRYLLTPYRKMKVR